ncbi:hypothetical protein THASP1DRAFT_26512 [Thamnocephalis sphaerospora]|uniref:DUF7707 domain-containing protein n=1 Tax=Thamnocephalis sphaerospora TaxID=78915 RepID=A0A4P9XH06_9FUNG|nr:hypothetical protein THASP1DRAFT_26512 [Thamnocephalis sphaerospora]|eukprot:RKP04922.1 hypothetical protein THASP1DRAFT_26512 [Thamnocephalis sphaerospora]
MRASVTFVALAVASVSAQTNYNFTSELDMTIDPNTVKQSDRAVWCRAQTDTCSLLCNKNAEVNSCTESTLKWNCTCGSNSSTPGIEFYQQTVPYFICEALYGQCIQQGAGTIRGQDVCNDNIKPLCATNPPPKEPVSDSSETSGTATSHGF